MRTVSMYLKTLALLLLAILLAGDDPFIERTVALLTRICRLSRMMFAGPGEIETADEGYCLANEWSMTS
jgi:hypothetical protein